MGPKPNDLPELYVVVCTDLHGAWGPFSTIQNALAFARERTDARESQCVYLPVQLYPAGGASWSKVPAPQQDSESYQPGRNLYL